VASYVLKFNFCEYCSVHSIVQGKTKLDWGNLSMDAPTAGRCCLGCNTLMCKECVDMFKPMLEDVFKHDTEGAVAQWPYLAALQLDNQFLRRYCNITQTGNT
jgi:hypothetical protein